MPVEGKSIDGLTADTKLATAASRIFESRLGAVDNQWQAALDDSNDPEPVHQLRVATRRARAALQVFGDLLAKRREANLSRILRRLRRAAGAARDWDVFTQHVAEWAATRTIEEKPGLDFLIGAAVARRCDAQDDLDDIRDRRTDWKSQIENFKIRGGKRALLRQRAEQFVPRLIMEFNSAADSDLHDAEKLHQLRIAGKRLRYALELFAEALGPDVQDRLLPAIEEVQDILGSANDSRNHACQVDELIRYAKRLDPKVFESIRVGIERWRQHLLDEAAAGPERFRRWQTQWNQIVASTNFASPP